MIGSLGMPELVFIMVLALLVFGPKRLPQVGRTLGKGLREFRRATSDLKRTVEVEINAPDEPEYRSPRPAAAASVEKATTADPDTMEGPPVGESGSDSHPKAESESSSDGESDPTDAAGAEAREETAGSDASPKAN